VPDNQLSFREIIVFLSAVIYWVGVIVNIYRVRKHIGRTPNIKPKGFKERLLWIGWFIVISGWIVQPLIINSYSRSPFFVSASFFDNLFFIIPGMVLIFAGYAGTLWCYSALGDSWRIGVNKKEKTILIDRGPYRSVRHPIYLFQILMLIGSAALLPTLLSVIIILIHSICILIKALDEESYLLEIHFNEYSNYISRTGRFFPSFRAMMKS
jgi:protein-S-isoprenylcysteine O-methyltransferase Ste14